MFHFTLPPSIQPNVFLPSNDHNTGRTSKVENIPPEVPVCSQTWSMLLSKRPKLNRLCLDMSSSSLGSLGKEE